MEPSDKASIRTRRTFLRLSALAGVGTLSVATLAACSAPSPAASPAAKATTAPPAASGAAPAASPAAKSEAPGKAPAKATRATTLVIAEPSVPAIFEAEGAPPVNQVTLFNVFDELVKYGTKPSPNGAAEIDASKIEPALAESWQVSEGGRVYTFNLRKGVKSVYGNELTAEDVKWSWDRAFAIPSTATFVYNIASVPNKEAIKAVDKYQFRVELSSPNSIFLSAEMLFNPTIYDSVEVKKHATAEDPWGRTWLRDHSAGFGAYQVDTITADQEASFNVNPEYWGGKPFFDRIVLRAVPSPSNRTALITTGEVDAAAELTAPQMNELKNRRGVVVNTVTGNRVMIARFNYKFPPLDNLKVRQAISYAWPYEDVYQSVFQGTARQMRGPMTDTFPGFTGDKYWKYDTNVDRAKQLLAEAGFASGLKLPVPLTYLAEDADSEPIALIAKTSLAKAGIEVDLEKMPRAVYNERRPKRDIPFILGYDQSVVLDPGYNMHLWFAPGPLGAANNTDYNNPQVTELLGQAKTELDTTKRLGYYDQIQRIVIEESPYVWVAALGGFGVVRDNIAGWTWYPHNRFVWKHLSRK